MGGTIFQNSYTSFQSKNFNRVHDPRKPIQSERRSTFAGMTSAWNAISDIERASWNEFKDPGLSGYNTFVRVNTRLAAVGEPMMTAYSDDTPPVSMFAVFSTFTTSSFILTCSGLTTTVPTDCILSVRACRVTSPGISFLPAGALKQFATFTAGTDMLVGQDVTTRYTDTVGPLQLGRRVFMQCLVQNTVSGMSSLGQRNTTLVQP